MTDLIKTAKELGFDTAVAFNPAILEARQDVREMCNADKCMIFGKNWGCPPHCGTVEQCQQKMHSYSGGILLQTTGHMTKAIDSRCYRETERRHLTNFYALADVVRECYPDALCLGAGGCRVCKKCAWPEECRFPEKRMSSMEGYGLFVTQVCRDVGVPYYYGEKTITYSACILY
jgi:predicted metal-binding protein